MFTALSFSFPLPGERQVLVLWGPPLAGEPRGYDVIRIPGGKRNDELLTDEDEDGDVGWLEELDADRDYAYRVVAVDDDGRHAVTGVARAADTNDGPQRAAATHDRRAPTALEIERGRLGEARDPRPALLRALPRRARRFRLRTGLTWLLMTASFGLTLALTYFLYLGGPPALPLLAIGFLVANGDLLWRVSRAPKPPALELERPSRRAACGNMSTGRARRSS